MKVVAGSTWSSAGWTAGSWLAFAGGCDAYFVWREDGSDVVRACPGHGLLFCRQYGAMCGINAVRAGLHRSMGVLLDMAHVQQALAYFGGAEVGVLCQRRGDNMNIGLLVSLYQAVGLAPVLLYSNVEPGTFKVEAGHMVQVLEAGTVVHVLRLRGGSPHYVTYVTGRAGLRCWTPWRMHPSCWRVTMEVPLQARLAQAITECWRRPLLTA